MLERDVCELYKPETATTMATCCAIGKSDVGSASMIDSNKFFLKHER